MLLTDIFIGDILLAKSGTTRTKRLQILSAGGKNMFIYDSLNYLQEENEEIGVNALSYVVLSCGR